MKLFSTTIRSATVTCACLFAACTSSDVERSNEVTSMVSNSKPQFDCYRQAFWQEYSVRDANDPDRGILLRASFQGKELKLDHSVYDRVNGENSRVVRETVTYPASMYITGVVHIGDGRLAVSGMDSTTSVARIEVWSFAKPTVYRVPASGGRTQSLLRPSHLNSVEVAFAPATDSGFGLVKSIWPNRGLGDGHLLVLNCYNRDLFSVNLEAKTATRFMSSKDQVGSHSPLAELTNNWVGSYGPRRHNSLGDAYILTMEDDIAPPDDAPVKLYLWDHDMDGSIDAAESLSNGQAAARGFVGPDVWDSSWPE